MVHSKAPSSTAALKKSDEGKAAAAAGLKSAAPSSAGSTGTASAQMAKKSAAPAQAPPTQTEEEDEYDEYEEDEGQVDSMAVGSGYVVPKIVVNPKDMPGSVAPSVAPTVRPTTKASVAVTIESVHPLVKKKGPRKKGKKGKGKKRVKTLSIGAKLPLTPNSKGKRPKEKPGFLALNPSFDPRCRADNFGQRASQHQLIFFGVLIGTILTVVIVVILLAIVLRKGSQSSAPSTTSKP